MVEYKISEKHKYDQNFQILSLTIVRHFWASNQQESDLNTVQSRFSDIEFSDNLWFSDYFSKTSFQFTT